MTRRPTLLQSVPGLRERTRADGSVRLWWEPPAAARAKGWGNVDLSAFRPGDAAREARRLNADAARALQSGGLADGAAPFPAALLAPLF
jgi:hypothetical protein